MMQQAPPHAPTSPPRAPGAGYLFGVPMGELGWFASLLITVAMGFVAFFAATFLGILGILIYNSGRHAPVDFAWSYTRIGLPVGVVALLFSSVYLGAMWFRRIGRR